MPGPERDTEALAAAIADALTRRGVPEGTWLIDITEARREVRRTAARVDDLLQRLQDAVVKQHEARGRAA
jgi:hypothetical protein